MVSLDELALGISELVESYADDVIKEIEKVLDETSDKVLAYIQSKAPKSGQAYGFAESFVALHIEVGNLSDHVRSCVQLSMHSHRIWLRNSNRLLKEVDLLEFSRTNIPVT